MCRHVLHMLLQEMGSAAAPSLDPTIPAVAIKSAVGPSVGREREAVGREGGSTRGREGVGWDRSSSNAAC